MAQDKSDASVNRGVSNIQSVAGSVGKKTRAKRVYTHAMSERERWALQILLKARSACSAVAISIQEGKPISPAIIARASDLISAAGEMMFAV